MPQARGQGVAHMGTRPFSRPPAPRLIHPGAGAWTRPSRAVWAATVALQPLAVAVAPAAVEPMRAVLDGRVLIVASVARAHATGGNIDAGDHSPGLSHRGLLECVAARREVVVDNAAKMAIRGVIKRAARIETQDRGGVTTLALDAQVLATASADNGEAVTDDR